MFTRHVPGRRRDEAIAALAVKQPMQIHLSAHPADDETRTVRRHPDLQRAGRPGPLFERLYPALDAWAQLRVVFVNDGSRDNSVASWPSSSACVPT
jgi:hypothetical protein